MRGRGARAMPLPVHASARARVRRPASTHMSHLLACVISCGVLEPGQAVAAFEIAEPGQEGEEEQEGQGQQGQRRRQGGPKG
jgi:hypothetical protein